MASGDNDDMGFEQSQEGLMNSPSSQMNTIPLSDKIDGMAMNSISMYHNKSSNGSHPFIDSGWHPIVPLSQSESLGGSSPMVPYTEFAISHYPLSMENHGITVTSHFCSQYQSDPSFVELVPNFPGLGSGNLSEMVGPFSLPQCSQIATSRHPLNYALDHEHEGGNERAATNSSQSCDDHWISEAVVGASPKGKSQKRVPESNSPIRSYQNADEEPQNDASGESSDVLKEQDAKKQRTEQNTAANSGGQAANRANDSSQTINAPKESYIHVRARRGQATNSHSLAERVRREKISERMRLLQELVPGCNKIIGKAVMLDEIINYVQSLQQQVEFLSMKLATVNPELNIDLERILFKDVLHSRRGSLGLSPGINSSHPFSPGIVLPGTISGIRSTNPQFHPLPQTLQHNELQNLLSYRI